jgi:hypothetical protein
MKDIYTMRLSDFRKINGVWFPFIVAETVGGDDDHSYPASELHFDNAEPNYGLADDQFEYYPPQGSTIYNWKTQKLEAVNYATGKRIPTTIPNP